jgi:GT2 family glycosyltransferase
MPAVSIVIPTLGRAESLREVLRGLAAQQPSLENTEVLVVLDAAAPANALSSVDLGEVAEVIRAEVAGASGARNAGWRAAGAPLILFLDDDIVPSPSLVAEHRSWHELSPEPEVGLLGLVKWSPRVRVSPFMRWLETGIQFDYGTIRSTEVEWTRFYSCNVSVKREMLELVDGFDEQRFPYGYEDLELARRLSEHGFRLLYNPAALGEHLKTETLERWRRNLRRIAQSERRFTQLYPGELAYFHELFYTAANAPRASGRPAHLARFISPRLPWLGRRVWASYDMVCRQQLAEEFLAEWQAADAAEDDSLAAPPQPD